MCHEFYAFSAPKFEALSSEKDANNTHLRVLHSNARVQQMPLTRLKGIERFHDGATRLARRKRISTTLLCMAKSYRYQKRHSVTIHSATALGPCG